MTAEEAVAPLTPMAKHLASVKVAKRIEKALMNVEPPVNEVRIIVKYRHGRPVRIILTKQEEEDIDER